MASASRGRAVLVGPHPLDLEYPLPKRNYGFEKRQKELNRQRKKEEKKQRKIDRSKEPVEPAPLDPPPEDGALT